MELALAQPHLSGIGFDLAPLQPIFEEYVASFDLTDRAHFNGGDFFADPIPQADVLIYGRACTTGVPPKSTPSWPGRTPRCRKAARCWSTKPSSMTTGARTLSACS